jgi:hypothetical protein
MSIEAMKQALEALEHDNPAGRSATITALREAIEFAEMVKKGTKAWADTPYDWVDDLRGGAEPVAWREIMGKWKTHYYDYNEDGRGEPLYTAPREWVGLTDEERFLNDARSEEEIEYARAIEAKLKEKNHG